MDTDTQTFCQMIRNRSDENQRVIAAFPAPRSVVSPAFSILRQELDSMVRAIYLLAIKDLTERRRLIRQTLKGERWQVKGANGKSRKVTDREMVELAQKLKGWTHSVYRVGCAFTHLSEFHNHFVQNPFDGLSKEDRQDILRHMRHYHGGRKATIQT